MTLKIASKRVESQACLSYPERERFATESVAQHDVGALFQSALRLLFSEPQVLRTSGYYRVTPSASHFPE